MKDLFKILSFAGVCTAFVCACQPEQNPVSEPVAPVVTYAIEEEAVGVQVDSVVLFEAVIQTPGPVECVWYVDEVIYAETLSFCWPFTTIGTYQVRFEAFNEAGKTEKEYTVTVSGIPLEVEFSVAEDEICSKVRDAVEISVDVLRGDRDVVHEWRLDGSVVSSSAQFSRAFSQAGTYSLVWTGVNREGMSATRTWTVTVEEYPLEVNFSVPEGDVSAFEQVSFEIEAIVTEGGTGVVQEWKVDGETVSGQSVFSYAFTLGSHVVTYSAVNAKGETVSAEWNLVVTEKVALRFMFDDYESSATVSSSFYKGNDNALSIVDNPAPASPVNPSSKVLVDDQTFRSKGGSSGYFIVYLGSSSDFSSVERKKYTTLKVKVYVLTTDIHIALQDDGTSERRLPSRINGQAFNPLSPSEDLWKSLMKADQWNELEYNLVDCGYTRKTFENISQIQFRPFSKLDCNTASVEPMYMIAYFDDLEFLE